MERFITLSHGVLSARTEFKTHQVVHLVRRCVTPQQGCESTCDGYLGKAEGQGGEERTVTTLIGAHHVVSERTAKRSSVEEKVQAPSAVWLQQPPLGRLVLVHGSLRLARPLSGPRAQGRRSSLVCIFPRLCEQCLITFPFTNLSLLRPNLYVPVVTPGVTCPYQKAETQIAISYWYIL